MDNVVGIITDALRALTAWLCEFIYPQIANFYQIFKEMGEMFYSDQISEIYNKISLIIGIFMVFRLTFWLIELLISPEKISDKEKQPGKIIIKVMMTIVLLAFTPRIFHYAAILQGEIINSNVIENLIAKDFVGEEKEVGGRLAANLFSNFYKGNNNPAINQDDDCITFYTGENGRIATSIREGNHPNISNYCLNKYEEVDTGSETEKVYVIDFNGLFAVGVGVIVFWMILMYCISVGARYVQLIFLQIVAPIPIMCNLAPGKDNMFSKWVKQCTTTYLDLFIRVVIINFVMLLADVIFARDNLLNIPGDVSGWIKIFLVLGLLTFAKKAPELIQELLPKSVTKASGDFGLSLKKRTESMLGGKFMYNAMKKAPGYALGGATGLAVGGVMGALGGKGVGSRIAGGLSGAVRGFNSGAKQGSITKAFGDVKKNQSAQNSRLQQWRVNASKADDEVNTVGDWWSRKTTATKRAMGFETPAEYLERGKSSAKSASEAYKSAKKNSREKAVEKQTMARAFGLKDVTLTELDQRLATAQQAVKENSKTTLLSTEDGNKKLENYFGSSDGRSWMIEHGILPTTNFNALDSNQKDSLANAFISKLQKEATKAADDVGDTEKIYGFAYQIEQAAGIIRDKDTKEIKTKADGTFLEGTVSEEYVNYFDTVNTFISKYDEKFNITTGDNPLFEGRTQKFDVKEMAGLMLKAEQGSTEVERIEAQNKLKQIFKDFDMLKALMSRVETVENQEQSIRDRANEKFTGK